MKNVSISITTSDGKTYPCRLTMGALRRFKAETGMDAEHVTCAADLAVLIWCCCKSACGADGVAFDVSLDDFCDRIDMSAAESFSKAIAPDEKKTKK